MNDNLDMHHHVSLVIPIILRGQSIRNLTFLFFEIKKMAVHRKILGRVKFSVVLFILCHDRERSFSSNAVFNYEKITRFQAPIFNIIDKNKINYQRRKNNSMNGR